MQLVIIGAGKASLEIINYFQSAEDTTIVAVVDRSDASPGIQKAKQLGISVGTDPDEFISREDVDMIVEITGVKEVLEHILTIKRPDQGIMSSSGAWMMNRAVSTIFEKQDEIASELDDLGKQMQSILKLLDGTVADVRNILTKMDILSINGSIAAGQSGSNDFVIIAERMGTLAKEVDAAMRQILESSDRGGEVVKSIIEAENRLKAA